MRLFRGNHNIFVRFILSYLLVFIIAMFSAMIIYQQSFKTMENYEKEKSLSELEKCRDTMDSRLKELENIINNLAYNKKINNALLLDSPYNVPNELFKLSDLQNEIEYFRITNEFVKDIHIYLNKSETVLTTYSTYLRKDNYYNVFFKYENYSYDEWKNMLYEKKYIMEVLPVSSVQINGKQANMALCIQTLPYPVQYKAAGAIVVFIDETTIQKQLSRINIEDGGFAYIVNSNNKTIFKHSKTEINELLDIDYNNKEGFIENEVNHQNMIIAYTQSEYNGWRYVAAIPKDGVMKKVEYIKKIYLYALFITALVGLLIAGFLSYKNSKPITEVIMSLKSKKKFNSTGIEGYKYIKESINNLLSSNELLQEKIEKQKPITELLFFEQLLKGNFASFEEMEHYLMLMGDVEMFDIGLVVVCKIALKSNNSINNSENNLRYNSNFFKNLKILKVMLIDVLKENVQGCIYAHDTDVDKIAAIIKVDNKKDIRKILERGIYTVRDIIKGEFGIELFFSASNTANDLMEVGSLYANAREALENKILYSKEIIWVEDIVQNNMHYYYPMDIETKLMYSARSGSIKSVENIIDIIYKENMRNRELDGQMMDQLLYDMRGTLIKLIGSLNVNDLEWLEKTWDKIQRIMHVSNIDEAISSIKQIYTEICESCNEKKKSHNVEMKKEIIEYIKVNFTQSNICLDSVADKFDINKVYLSQFFKEQTGETFTSYIENLRIIHACELMNNSKMSLEAIANEVGYSSAQSFRKAFKRVRKMNPSEYKLSL